jgi:hypothetical protein
MESATVSIAWFRVASHYAQLPTPPNTKAPKEIISIKIVKIVQRSAPAIVPQLLAGATWIAFPRDSILICHEFTPLGQKGNFHS